MVLFKGMGTKRPDYSDEKAIVDLDGLPSGDIANYQAFLARNGYTPQEVQGFAQGLNSGNQGIQNWIDNYNTENLNNPILQPKTEEEIALARQGQFNVSQPQESQELTAAKQSLFNKFVNGMTDLANGYQENRNTAYSPENLRANGNENFMTRLGEVAGTGARFANSPAGQAIIAGLGTAAMGGSVGNILQNAYNYGSERIRTNAYADQLKQLGVNYTPTLMSKLSAQDVSAMSKPVYEQWANEIAKQKMNETERYHDLMNQIYLDRLEEQKRYHNQTDEYRKGQLQNQKERTQIQKQKASNGGGSKKPAKPEHQPYYNDALSEYMQIANSGDANKTNHARANFIKRYGIDPDKKISTKKPESNGVGLQITY